MATACGECNRSPTVDLEKSTKVPVLEPSSAYDWSLKRQSDLRSRRMPDSGDSFQRSHRRQDGRRSAGGRWLDVRLGASYGPRFGVRAYGW